MADVLVSLSVFLLFGFLSTIGSHSKDQHVLKFSGCRPISRIGLSSVCKQNDNRPICSITQSVTLEFNFERLRVRAQLLVKS